MRRPAIWFAILSLTGAALACNLPPGVPVTPTVIPTLPHPTVVVLAATPTPTPFLSATPTFTLPPTNTLTPSRTFTPTATDTSTPSFTPTLTPTPSATFTPTAVPTDTYTLTPTDTLTPTFTGIPTDTPTDTPLPTLTPSYTLPPPSNTPTLPPTVTPTSLPTDTATELPTSTPVPLTDTPAPTLTPLPTSTDTPVVPTDTPAPTLTAVPQPSVTANLPTTAPSGTPTPLPPLPTAYSTATPPGVIVISTSVGSGGGNGNGGGGNGNGGSTPGAGAIGGVFGTVTAIAGTARPTAAYLFYAGGNGGGSIYRSGGLVTTLQPGQTYVVNLQTGAAASVANGELFINSQPYTLSPSSRYGTGQKFQVSLISWSPDGRFLAFRVETPNARSGTLSFKDTIDDGIWIYEPAANKSWQTFRNQYRSGQTIEIVEDFWWTNDSRMLFVSLGWGYVLVDSSVDINRGSK